MASSGLVEVPMQQGSIRKVQRGRTKVEVSGGVHFPDYLHQIRYMNHRIAICNPYLHVSHLLCTAGIRMCGNCIPPFVILCDPGLSLL